MKKIIVFGVIIIVLGLLIALGPQFIFKVCGHSEENYPLCHWTAQAELGLGALIAALGACMAVLVDPKIHIGLSIGAFLAGIVALFIPYTLIGGCGMMSMQCRKVAFPALTVECVALLVFVAVTTVYFVMKQQKTAG